MRVLLLGSEGQLGKSIILTKPSSINLISLDRKVLDISNKQDCKKNILKYRPDWIINAAAYTEVDNAEKNKKIAFKVNRDGPKFISDILRENGGKLIHISTDFVFNGESNKPYKPNDIKNPISIYGLSKSEGEDEIIKNLNKNNSAIILRTSWLMGPFGNNFANTMLKLHSIKEQIKVVNDQIGCPTSTLSLANICWHLIFKSKEKNKINFPLIMHWRDEGITNWYDIAIEIGKIGIKYNLIQKSAKVIPISSFEYKSLAKRPNYSVLDISETIKLLGVKPIDWKKSISNSFNTKYIN